MAWETDRHGRTRYVQKIRIGGRVTSKILGSGETGRTAEQSILRQRQEEKHRHNVNKELQSKLDIYERTVNQIVEQSLINQGFIKRNGNWQRVSRLNKPLTSNERAYIKQVKTISECLQLEARS